MAKILILSIFYYPDKAGGANRLAYDEAVFLAEQGHEVWIIAQDATGQKPEYEFRDSLHILLYQQPQLGLFSPKRPFIHQLTVQNLLTKYLADGVDVVHGHGPLQYRGAIDFYGDKVRKLYSVHSPVKMEMEASSQGAATIKKIYYAITAYLLNRIERKCLASSDVVTAESFFTQQMMKQLHGDALGSKVQIVHGWVDTQRFQILPNRDVMKHYFGWRTDVPILFTLRRLVPRMGLDRLLYALQKVKTAGFDFRMIIGGSGVLRSELELLSQRLELTDKVQFVGFVSEEDLPKMYGAADLFILPTSALECFGLPTIEALACGTPVIATPVAAIPEVVNHFESQWLTRDNSAEAIAERIIEFLQGNFSIPPAEKLREKVIQLYERQHVLDYLSQLVLTKI